MVPTPTTTCSPARACWLRAWDRAKAEKLIPYRNADGTWSVKQYTISITGAGWSDLSCSCPAGRQSKVCKHAAVVAKAIACRVSPVRGTAHVTDNVVLLPAPAPTSAPAPAGAPAWRSIPVASPLDALYG